MQPFLRQLEPDPVPTTIDEYLASLPAKQRAELGRLRVLLHTVVPGAEEAIRTRVPAILYRGKTVVGFGAAREHLALYVMFGNALNQLRDELADYDVSSKVVRFTPETPLPAALITRVVKVRLAEIDAASKAVAG